LSHQKIDDFSLETQIPNKLSGNWLFQKVIFLKRSGKGKIVGCFGTRVVDFGQGKRIKINFDLGEVARW